MAKTDKEFDKIFRVKLENHEEKPPTEAWHRLEAQLDKQQQVPKKSTFWWAIAAAVPLLLGASYLFWASDMERDGQETLAQAQEIKTEEEQAPPVIEAAAVQEKEVLSIGSTEISPARKGLADSSPEEIPVAISSLAAVQEQSEALPPSSLGFIAEIQTPPSAAVSSSISASLVSIDSASPMVSEALASNERSSYRIHIYSDGLKKAVPKEKNLLTELGKTVGLVEGLLGKLDDSLEDLQEKKGLLFSSLTSRKEETQEKQ